MLTSDARPLLGGAQTPSLLSPPHSPGAKAGACAGLEAENAQPSLRWARSQGLGVSKGGASAYPTLGEGHTSSSLGQRTWGRGKGPLAREHRNQPPLPHTPGTKAGPRAAGHRLAPVLGWRWTPLPERPAPPCQAATLSSNGRKDAPRGPQAPLNA